MSEIKDYSGLSQEELADEMKSLKDQEKTLMITINKKRRELEGVTNEINKVMFEVGKQNAAETMKDFKLTTEHVALLKASGGDLDQIKEYPDEQIAQILGWSDSEDNEKRIAVLINELPIAKRFMIANFDESQVETDEK